MTSTANGRRVLRCALQAPRVGVWHARVSVDAEEPTELEGEVELVLAGAVWKGAARRAGANVGRVELLVVGGAGGLSTELEPRYYADAAASVVLEDLLRESGEELSPRVLPAVTSAQLARWTRPRGRAGRALSDLARALEVDAWRVLEDGTLWLGDETWPEVELEHDVVEIDPAQDRLVLAVDELSLTPGSVLGGRGVSYVVHLVEPDGQVRSVVWVEEAGQAGAPDPGDGVSLATPPGGGGSIER